MSLKLSDLVKSMVDAAKNSLASDWPKVEDYGRPELKKLSQSLIDIARLAADGKINARQAKAILQIHRNTTQTVMLTVEGMGLIAVEKAINAALKSVADAVNAAAGMKIV